MQCRIASGAFIAYGMLQESAFASNRVPWVNKWAYRTPSGVWLGRSCPIVARLCMFEVNHKGQQHALVLSCLLLSAGYWELLSSPESQEVFSQRARSASDAAVLRRKGHLKEQVSITSGSAAWRVPAACMVVGREQGAQEGLGAGAEKQGAVAPCNIHAGSGFWVPLRCTQACGAGQGAGYVICAWAVGL
jgi:hypothetical protein